MRGAWVLFGRQTSLLGCQQLAAQAVQLGAARAQPPGGPQVLQPGGYRLQPGVDQPGFQAGPGQAGIPDHLRHPDAAGLDQLQPLLDGLHRCQGLLGIGIQHLHLALQKQAIGAVGRAFKLLPDLQQPGR